MKSLQYAVLSLERRTDRMRSPRTARRRATIEIALAGVSAAVFIALARRVSRRRPPAIDVRARDLALRARTSALTAALAPIEPLGYPVAYIPVAHLCSRWLQRRGVTNANDVATSAWATWIAHRAFKLFHERQRPPRGARKKGWKRDSYPSGHTAGITGFSLALANVLHANRRIPRGAAIALGALPPIVVGASRIYEDMHWFSDVIGGWLLGATVALTVDALSPPVRRHYRASATGTSRRSWRTDSTSFRSGARPSVARVAAGKRA